MQLTSTETLGINPVMENILITDPLKLQGNPTTAADILEAMTESTLFQSAFTDIPKTVPMELTIEITESKIRELWCKGIMPDLTYVSFALEFNNGKSLDVSRFASEWSVTELSESMIQEGWKAKILKVRSVLNAMCVLNDKNYSDTDISVKVNQLSLFD
jgi:hypothetical protein